MLPERYQHALNAMKNQAAAVSSQIMTPTKTRASTAKLVEAQRQMNTYDTECRHIVRVLLRQRDQRFSIPLITEEQLASLLNFSSTAVRVTEAAAVDAD